MYELFFYVGLVLCIACFVLAVFLFFSQNVIGAIKYFLKLDTKLMNKKKNSTNNVPIIIQNNVNNVNQNTNSIPNNPNVLNANLLNNSAQRNNYKTNNGLVRNLNEPTEIINDSNMNISEKTELLGVANFATALLDADSTTVLPNIEDEV